MGLGVLRFAVTGSLEIGYYEAGPSDGEPVLLLHGFPYDVHSYAEVVPVLVAAGKRVIVPYLRGHGPTRFTDESTPRSGQQAAIGRDVIELMDALNLDRAVLAGYDWGGRAACVAAAVWPERCSGLVSVNGYLVQDIKKAGEPVAPELEAGFWYFYYFSTERGRVGLMANRREVARVIWCRNSPCWKFDEDTLNRTAVAFDNPDYVDVVVHSYRHRLGLTSGCQDYADIEAALALQPAIAVPTVTLDGLCDGNFPATDGEVYSRHFTGPHLHRQVPGAGHNLPQEAPVPFAEAILALDEMP